MNILSNLDNSDIVPRDVGGSNVKICCLSLKQVVMRNWYDSVQKKPVKNDMYDDNVITCYFELIKSRAEKNKSTLPSVDIINAVHWTDLTSNYSDKHNTLIKSVSLFQSGIVLFPVKLDKHWSLMVIDNERRLVCYYDPYNQAKTEMLSEMKKIMAREATKRGWRFNSDRWGFSQERNFTKVEEKKNDSGAYICLFGEFLSRRAKLPCIMNGNNIRVQQCGEIISNELFYK